MGFHKLKIRKNGRLTALFLDGTELKFIEKYKLEESPYHAALTVTLSIDKNIACEMADDK